eukprot:6916481-Pyramimonas_sp.AAC.1
MRDTTLPPRPRQRAGPSPRARPITGARARHPRGSPASGQGLQELKDGSKGCRACMGEHFEAVRKK